MGGDRILNSKDKKHLFQKMREQWGTDTDCFKDMVIMKKSSGKIFMSNMESAKLEQEINVRIYSMGNYFGKEEKDALRLSIEGSQMIGPHSTKNIIELDDSQIKEWISGNDVEISERFDGHCIVRNGNDFYGCGNAKHGRLINHVPKTRRIKNIIE